MNKGIKINNTSSFFQNIFNSSNHSKSIIIQNSFTQMRNLEYKMKNLNEILTNENIFKISNS